MENDDDYLENLKNHPDLPMHPEFMSTTIEGRSNRSRDFKIPEPVQEIKSPAIEVENVEAAN